MDSVLLALPAGPSVFSRPSRPACAPAGSRRRPAGRKPLGTLVGGVSMAERSSLEPGLLALLACARTLSRSVRPTSSSTVRTPRLAMNLPQLPGPGSVMKFTTYSGLPWKRFRSSGFWVAMPMGQVSRLHTRIMTQPRVDQGGGGEAEFLCAQQRRRWPRRGRSSACRRPPAITRERRPFWIRVWWASASPSSQGRPALWMEVCGGGPGAAVIAGDENDLGPGLGHAGGDGADAGLSCTSFTRDVGACRLAFFRS